MSNELLLNGGSSGGTGGGSGIGNIPTVNNTMDFDPAWLVNSGGIPAYPRPAPSPEYKAFSVEAEKHLFYKNRFPYNTRFSRRYPGYVIHIDFIASSIRYDFWKIGDAVRIDRVDIVSSSSHGGNPNSAFIYDDGTDEFILSVIGEASDPSANVSAWLYWHKIETTGITYVKRTELFQSPSEWGGGVPLITPSEDGTTVFLLCEKAHQSGSPRTRMIMEYDPATDTILDGPHNVSVHSSSNGWGRPQVMSPGAKYSFTMLGSSDSAFTAGIITEPTLYDTGSGFSFRHFSNVHLSGGYRSDLTTSSPVWNDLNTFMTMGRTNSSGTAISIDDSGKVQCYSRDTMLAWFRFVALGEFSEVI